MQTVCYDSAEFVSTIQTKNWSQADPHETLVIFERDQIYRAHSHSYGR